MRYGSEDRVLGVLLAITMAVSFRPECLNRVDEIVPFKPLALGRSRRSSIATQRPAYEAPGARDSRYLSSSRRGGSLPTRASTRRTAPLLRRFIAREVETVPGRSCGAICLTAE